jgi:hypothetical protein
MEKIEITITKNNFDLEFIGFKGTSKIEYDILNRCFLGIKDNIIKFKLIQINKKIQPLEILVKLKNNIIIGQLILNVKDEEETNVGKIKFKNLKFTEINNLIDFNYTEENKESYIDVKIEHDGIIYESRKGKEEKI